MRNDGTSWGRATRSRVAARWRISSYTCPHVRLEKPVALPGLRRIALRTVRDEAVLASRGHRARVAARASPVIALLLCAFLAPIVAHAAALVDDTSTPDWIASFSGLHAWASDVAPRGDVYRSFGLVTPVVYLLLLLGLWLSPAPRTRLLRWSLGGTAVADVLAYGLPRSANAIPGTIEFLGLFLLLVGVGIAAWAQRCNREWAFLVALCIPLAFVGLAVVQYWPHGALLGVATACCLLSWAPQVPASDRSIILPAGMSQNRGW